MPKRKKTSVLMGELPKKRNASTAVQVSLDGANIRTSIDTEESQVVAFLLQVRKALANKTCD